MASLTHSLPVSALRGTAAPTVPFLARARHAIWTGLCEIGQRRARVVLLNLARDHEESRPEFAAQLRTTARRSWL